MSAPCENLHLHAPHTNPRCPGRTTHPDNANLTLCVTRVPCNLALASQRGESAGLAFLLRFAADRDDDARMHYFHAVDGTGTSCGCRYEGVGS